jgi:NADPH:quinone reductase-like Zn-dependent oxidoreductase
LLKVRAASVNPLDAGLMKGKPHSFRIFFGLRKPRLTRPGVDVAGQVEAVGRNVMQFKPGDEVFGMCKGAFAEYACAPESGLSIKPANLTFEQAASAPVAALTALQGLRDKGHIHSGQKVLINGAAGGVGTFAVQIAKSFGADVTGVCSTRNGEMVRSIGTDHVIDYTRQDFTESGKRYDLIFDCFVNHSLSACRRALNLSDGGSAAQAVDGRYSRSGDQSTCIVTVRESEVRRLHCEIKQRGSDHDERAHGVRKSKTGDRQALQVE